MQLCHQSKKRSPELESVRDFQVSAGFGLAPESLASWKAEAGLGMHANGGNGGSAIM